MSRAQATTSSAIAERRVQMPAPAGNATAPEKHLNRFVHLVALLERAGNALGTLAFTWATVILLGGYPTVLRYEDDFWFATVIVFLEAFRMFSRNNRPDYQLFFRTRGAFSPLGLDGLILIGCVSHVLASIELYFYKYKSFSITAYRIGLILCSGVARSLVPNPLHRAISLWSPMVAIMLLGPCVPYNGNKYCISLLDYGSSAAGWTIIYLVLLVVVLLLTISRMRFPCIIRLVDRVPRIKLAFWRRVILKFCLLAALLMLAFASFQGRAPYSFFVIEVCAFFIASLGNLQLPTAVVRIVLALLRLIPQNYEENNNHGDKTNLVPSLNLFYGMVFGQGILYVVACMLEVFSFILRRRLVRHAGFRGQLGVEYVNLYYAYAFEKCMGGAVLAPKKIGLVRFAVDCLESDSSKMQVRGLQMLYHFLKMELIRTKAISELTRSMKTVTLLFNMFGSWTSEADRDIRIFAAKVTVEIADNLRVVHIPGAIQLVSSLLETGHQAQIRDHLLYIGKEEEKQDFLIQQVDRNGQNSPMLQWWKQIVMHCFVPVDEPMNMDEQTSHIIRWWKHIIKCCSVPEEEPLMDQDILPVLGLLIIDRLASIDLENCMEISRATGLISKIIEFTSMRSNITNINETDMILLKVSSLKVLRRLSSIKGKYGVTVRQNISEHPFLLSNLAGVLNHICNTQELRELTTEILRNIAIDGNTSNEIGNIRVIISSLLHEFISPIVPSSTDSNQLLRMISGQALALLAMESVHNCLSMLVEPGYTVIKELTIMIHTGRHRCIAATLLWNISLHARHMLCNSDRKELSYILREVLERIMDAEGAELEVLVGLSAQMCNIIPEDFFQELEHGHIKEMFVRRLVDALNANMIPSVYCPGIRRVIVEHTMCMMKCNSSYANCFKKYSMMEALLMVERTPSRAENYRLFLGDAGVMKHSIPLSTLVARTKELMGGGSLQGMSSGT